MKAAILKLSPLPYEQFLTLRDNIAVHGVLVLTDFLPTTASTDTQAVLKDQARKLCEILVHAADRETLLMLCPLLARLNESMNGSK